MTMRAEGYYVRPFDKNGLRMEPTLHGVRVQFRCGDRRSFSADDAEEIAERLLAAAALSRAKLAEERSWRSSLGVEMLLKNA